VTPSRRRFGQTRAWPTKACASIVRYKPTKMKLAPFLVLVCALAALAATATTACGLARPTPPAGRPNSSRAGVSQAASDRTPGFPLGRTVLLAPRTRRLNCTFGLEPDRRCSPGAYYTRLTKAVLCSHGFRSSELEHLTDAAKHAVEVEYGLTGGRSSALTIDHIVPLELGGSNNVANLYPQRAPVHQLKETLDSTVAARVCKGLISLGAARRQIAVNWELLYTKLDGAGH
jgi:hypothetical protein